MTVHAPTERCVGQTESGFRGGARFSPVGGPLSGEQVEEFIERGFTVLPEGFPSRVAEEIRAALGRRIGIDVDDPAQWVDPRVWLREVLTEPPFTESPRSLTAHPAATFAVRSHVDPQLDLI
jgi:hypothetical protein